MKISEILYIAETSRKTLTAIAQINFIVRKMTRTRVLNDGWQYNWNNITMINKRSLEKYCCEDISLIENYQNAKNDSTQMWDCHHKLEMFYTKQELIDMNCYYGVPARALILVTKKQHWWWPHKGREIGREKMKGNQNGKGTIGWRKGIPMTVEEKEKIRQAHLGKHHTLVAKAKVSLAFKGLLWWNNGIKNVRSRECPEGFVKGRIKRKCI